MPTSIRLPSGEDWAVWNAHDARMLWREIFESEVYREAAAFLVAGSVVMDIGAHTGLSALNFSRAAPGVRIEAFEPAPLTYECLAQNLDAYVHGAVAHPYAIGAVEGYVAFAYYPATPSQSGCYASRAADDRLTTDYLLTMGMDEEEATSIVRDLHIPEMITVPVRTVSGVLASMDIDRVDLMKIDVERAELDVLVGVAGRDWARIGAVVVEVHDLDGRLALIREVLGDRGFRVSARQEDWLVGSELWTVHATR